MTTLWKTGAMLALAGTSLTQRPSAQNRPQPAEERRWRAQAAHTTITRDTWGIAHIHGHSDADAVFGMIYAQCEDDFPRIERNYLTALGRTAEADGPDAIWADLRQRLFIDPADLQREYRQSPAWLRALMDAWADGINFFLSTHPDIHPQVLTRFQPWMALSFTEGSIGGDIERINLAGLRALYDSGSEHTATPVQPPALAAPRLASDTWAGPPTTTRDRLNPTLADPILDAINDPLADPTAEPHGSNGIAIAPRLTRNGHALLLINPHTSFFFRSELQMTSDQGLDAYGAVTWGQFFIYQGFNPRVGWMHTSSGVDAVDEFIEPATLKPAHLSATPPTPCSSAPLHPCRATYELPAAPTTPCSSAPLQPCHTSPARQAASSTEAKPAPAQLSTHLITLNYKTPKGPVRHIFTTYASTHGPITRRNPDGTFIATSLMNRHIAALEQSYTRTKSRNYADYTRSMQLMANSSNNTVYADSDGTIAYWHGDFIPRRDPRFDYTKPVDGANPATAWHGLLRLDEVPQLKNPASGWLFNVNDSPWNGAGPSSLKQARYPAYVEQGIESARGTHALRVLTGPHTAQADWTIESLRAAAYDSFLPWFARTLPALFAAFDALPAGSSQRASLAPAIAQLRVWDLRWSAGSTATSLAVFWGTELLKEAGAPARAANRPSEDFVATEVPPAQLLQALASARKRLQDDFGASSVPWGEINRFQRLTADIAQPFSDTAPSIPVPFVSSLWGSLASFGAKPYPGTKRWYGTVGNSFVAIVEFGPRIHAVAVTAGGESGHPTDPHFNDEAERYAQGNLREVFFYPDQLQAHTERRYHPGHPTP